MNVRSESRSKRSSPLRTPICSVAELVSELSACDGADEWMARVGARLAGFTTLREFWWIDSGTQTLHARAGGLLPLDARAVTSLDAPMRGLLRAACESPCPRLLEGELPAADGEISKIHVLAVPLRSERAHLGALGLVSTAPATFPAALPELLAAAGLELARSLETSELRARANALEAELRRVDPLVALGRLSAAVAHEIRNPLTAMSHALGLLGRTAGLLADDRRLLGLVRDELERVSRIANDFLGAARPLDGREVELDLRHTLESAAVLLRSAPALAPSVEIRVEIGAGLPPIRGDADRIRQVFWNLGLNAAQSVPAGGCIVIAAQAHADAGRPGVVVEIRDSGPGIPVGLRERVFVAFETGRVEGTGLGLTLARTLIALHGGWIRIDEAPEGGANLRFWLPAVVPVSDHEEWD